MSCIAPAHGFEALPHAARQQLRMQPTGRWPLLGAISARAAASRPAPKCSKFVHNHKCTKNNHSCTSLVEVMSFLVHAAIHFWHNFLLRISAIDLLSAESS
jgi:hypothetical protein